MLNKQEVQNIISSIKDNITEEVKNIVCIVGEIESYPIHTEKNVIQTKIRYVGPRGIVDNIPFKMEENRKIQLEPGKKILVIGESRSEDTGNFIKRLLWVNYIDEVDTEVDYFNFMYLKAYLCKKVGLKFIDNRPVSSGVVCVESSKPHQYYFIPLTAWHRNALALEKCDEWDIISLHGWVQIKEYVKDGQNRVGYEMSVRNIVNCGK